MLWQISSVQYIMFTISDDFKKMETTSPLAVLSLEKQQYTFKSRSSGTLYSLHFLCSLKRSPSPSPGALQELPKFSSISLQPLLKNIINLDSASLRYHLNQCSAAFFTYLWFFVTSSMLTTSRVSMPLRKLRIDSVGKINCKTSLCKMPIDFYSCEFTKYL